MPAQQQAPIKSGLPPVLTSLTISVLRPIAAIAMTMKNLLSSLSGANTAVSTPAAATAVVISEAAIKYSIKKGKIFFKLNFCASCASCEPAAAQAAHPAPPAFICPRRATISANISVIGMIASVLVSLTVTALSSVSLPKAHMLSQVEAAAVTEEVSLTAVPAKMPKASPEPVSKPIAAPKAGKIDIRIDVEEKDHRDGLRHLFVIGTDHRAVAAMALPPQIEEPTPTSVEVLAGIFSHLCRAKAIKSAAPIVQTMIGSDAARYRAPRSDRARSPKGPRPTAESSWR